MLVLGALAGCAAPQPEASYAERLARQFERIAFQDEYRRGSGTFDRWEGNPVLIRLTNGAEHGRFIEHVAADLANMSGVEIRLARAEERSNVLVTFTNRCEATGERPNRAQILIDPSRLAACAREEIYQTLALANDACEVPSILCDNGPSAFTEADRLLMRIAFDPRLRVGMTAAEAMPIARQSINEKLQGEARWSGSSSGASSP